VPAAQAPDDEEAEQARDAAGDECRDDGLVERSIVADDGAAGRDGADEEAAVGTFGSSSSSAIVRVLSSRSATARALGRTLRSPRSKPCSINASAAALSA